MNGGKFIDVSPRSIEKKRGLPAQRSSQIAVEYLGVIGMLRDEDERISRVEDRIAVVEEKLPMQFVASRLGKDLDSAITQALVLGGKGILIDANLANGRFGRQLASGETIDVDLAAIGPGRGPGERRQFRLKFVGVVGQRFQVFSLDDQ